MTVEVTRPDLVKLLQERGEGYWQDELGKAKHAVTLYGVAVFVGLGMYLLPLFAMDSIDQGTQSFLTLGAFFVNFGATLYAGAAQSSLLPFMDAKPWAHWLSVILMMLIGCGGLIWWFFFSHYNEKAEKNIRLAFLEGGGKVAKSIPIPAPSASSPPKQNDQPIVYGEDFEGWIARLDAYLESLGLPTRSVHFRPGSLAYGYREEMPPEEFLKTGYNKTIDDAPAPLVAAKSAEPVPAETVEMEVTGPDGSKRRVPISAQKWKELVDGGQVQRLARECKVVILSTAGEREERWMLKEDFLNGGDFDRLYDSARDCLYGIEFHENGELQQRPVTKDEFEFIKRQQAQI
jgi:hypothetical protein